MQLPSIIVLLLSTTVSVSAFPAAIEARDTTGPKSADSACDHSGGILGQQLAEMAKLKAQNISIPPYLAGYYSALNSEQEEIGCLGTVSGQSTPNRDPCEVTNEQLERMMEVVDRSQKNDIGVAPFIAGFLSAAQDEHKAFGCPAFTSKATDASVNVSAAADTTNHSG